MRRASRLSIVILLILGICGDGRARQRPTPPSSEEQARADAVAKFEEGQKAHEQGRLDEAIALYTAALQRLPDFPEALAQRAAAYLARGQLDESETDLRRLLERETELMGEEKPPDPILASFFARAHALLAEVLLVRQRTEEAEQHAQRAVALDPRSPRARTVRASVALARRAYAEAAAELKHALELGLETAMLYTMLGFATEKLGDMEAALRAYDRAIALDPQAAAAREARSALLLERGEYTRAIEDLEVLSRLRPTSDVSRRLAEAYAVAGRLEDALTLLLKILERDPTDRLARDHAITLLDRLGRRDEALMHARRLVETSPDDPRAQARLGDLLLETDPERALAAYERATRADPENLAYRINLGAALLKLRRFPEAIEIFRAVLERDPNNHQAHVGLGTAYFEVKDYARAAREFSWVIERRPALAPAYYFLAICYDRMGEYERALPMYERFLALADPTKHRTEIESVQFRLPALRRQIEETKKRRRR